MAAGSKPVEVVGRWIARPSVVHKVAVVPGSRAAGTVGGNMVVDSMWAADNMLVVDSIVVGSRYWCAFGYPTNGVGHHNRFGSRLFQRKPRNPLHIELRPRREGTASMPLKTQRRQKFSSSISYESVKLKLQVLKMQKLWYQRRFVNDPSLYPFRKWRASLFRVFPAPNFGTAISRTCLATHRARRQKRFRAVLAEGDLIRLLR